VFKHKFIAKSDFDYILVSENEFMVSKDSLMFNIQVIKDEYPTIGVNEYRDENNYGIINFSGTISDDHGFLSLSFYHRKDSIPELSCKK